MASRRKVAVEVLWDALERVRDELDDESMSKRKMAKVERFYDELEDELNRRAEEIVDEPRYLEDVDAYRVGEEPQRDNEASREGATVSS